MEVNAVAAADTTAAEDEARLASIFGAGVYIVGVGIANQGSMLKATVDQSFGDESPLEKAREMDIA